MEVPPPLSRKHVAALSVVLVVLATVAVLVLSGVITVTVGVLGGTGDPPPQGSFHIKDSGEAVTIVRDVGGPVDAKKLEIRVDNQARGTWYELSNGSTTVERGDRISVRRDSDSEPVALYWIGSETPERLVHHDA